MDVTIGISTRNRKEVLTTVLDHLLARGLNNVRLDIIDDHSDLPLSIPALRHFPRGAIENKHDARGYIVRRNELLARCTTSFLLSLDDDSFPLDDGLENALHYASLQTNLLALSFPIVGTNGCYQLQSEKDVPYRCQTFVGCAHLMHVKHFNKLGGYREALIHQGEESDLSYRGFTQGLSVIHYPRFTIKHLYTPTARSYPRMNFFGARNKVVWNRLYRPAGNAMYHNMRVFVERCYLAVKTSSFYHIKGVFAGLVAELGDLPSSPRNRALIRRWKNLPLA